MGEDPKMFSKSAGKTLLRNVIRHTDTHNRLVEEDEMWRQKRVREERLTDSRYGNHDNRRGNTSSRYEDHEDDHKNSRVKSSCQRVPRAHMDREEETRPHSYMDREPEKKSTFFTRELAKAEDADPDRWGHNGFREMYPQDFRSDRSLSEDSRDKHRPRKTRKHKVRKYHHKSPKKRAKHKKSRKKSSDSERGAHRKKSKRREPEEIKSKALPASLKTRTELWVEKTCEIVKSEAYETPVEHARFDSHKTALLQDSSSSLGSKGSVPKRKASSSSEIEDGQLPNSNKRLKTHRSYRRKDRSDSSPGSDDRSHSKKLKFSSSSGSKTKPPRKSSKHHQYQERKRKRQQTSSSLSSPSRTSSSSSSLSSNSS